jgi:DNA topoisomerase IA
MVKAQQINNYFKTQDVLQSSQGHLHHQDDAISGEGLVINHQMGSQQASLEDNMAIDQDDIVISDDLDDEQREKQAIAEVMDFHADDDINSSQ